MTISLSRLNLLLFSFMIFGASMFQENTYFIKLSFVTLIIGLLIINRNLILSFFSIDKLSVSKPFFLYLFAYGLYLFLLYFSMFINDAYNNFSSQVWKSTYLNILLVVVTYIVAKELHLQYLKYLLFILLAAFFLESLYVFLTFNPLAGLRAEGFGGILQLGQDTSFILSILLSYFIYRKYNKMKYSYLVFFMFFFFFYALYATGSRSPVLGLLIASAFIYFTLTKSLNIKVFLKIFLYLSIVIASLYFANSQFQMQVNSILNPLNDVSNTSKLVANLISLSMFIDSPFFGTGLGTFESLKDIYMPSIISSSIIDEVGVPHNMYLGILGETGIFVFFVYLYIMLKPIFIYKKLFNMYRNQKFSYIFLGLMGFSIGYSIDAFFHNYYTQNFIWIVIGFGYGMLANKKLMGVKNEYSKN